MQGAPGDEEQHGDSYPVSVVGSGGCPGHGERSLPLTGELGGNSLCKCLYSHSIHSSWRAVAFGAGPDPSLVTRRYHKDDLSWLLSWSPLAAPLSWPLLTELLCGGVIECRILARSFCNLSQALCVTYPLALGKALNLAVLLGSSGVKNMPLIRSPGNAGA